MDRSEEWHGRDTIGQGVMLGPAPRGAGGLVALGTRRRARTAICVLRSSPDFVFILFALSEGRLAGADTSHDRAFDGR